jgi:uncharacterized protein YacL
MGIQDDLRTIGHLAGDSVEQLAKLVQNEATLAKTEISAKLAEALRGVAYLAAATLFITPAITLTLLAMAQWLMQQGVAAAAAYLIAAAVGLGLGAILALIGIQRLKADNLAPTVTARQIERDMAVAKEITR